MPLAEDWRMSIVVDAVYEKGVLRLLERLNLPEHQQVRLTVEPVSPGSTEPPAASDLAHTDRPAG